MAELGNCSVCGRLFLDAGSGVCPACHQADEEAFARVHAYVAEHGGCGVDEVSQATGVPAAAIRRYLREGRLQAVAGAGLACAACGTPIPHGRYCPTCAARLARELQAAQERPDAPRVYTWEKDDPR